MEPQSHSSDDANPKLNTIHLDDDSNKQQN